MSSGAGVSNPSFIPGQSNTICKREAVFPTRQMLGQMKSKLKGAQTGHSLLKRKSEALTKYVLPIYLKCHANHPADDSEVNSGEAIILGTSNVLQRF